MRFIHMADMHFDTPFTFLNSKEDLGNIRRLEQRILLLESNNGNTNYTEPDKSLYMI